VNEELQLVINIDKAVTLFGEPEYEFYKEYMQSRGRGKDRRHMAISRTPVSKEEFDGEYRSSYRLEVERFMGRFQGSFWRYDFKVKTPGWPQKLKSLLDQHVKNQLPA